MAIINKGEICCVPEYPLLVTGYGRFVSGIDTAHSPPTSYVYTAHSQKETKSTTTAVKQCMYRHWHRKQGAWGALSQEEAEVCVVAMACIVVEGEFSTSACRLHHETVCRLPN